MPLLSRWLGAKKFRSGLDFRKWHYAAGKMRFTDLKPLSAVCLVLFVTVLSSVGAPERYTVSRLPIEVERVAPVSVVEVQPGHLFIDFGQVSFAGLELTVPNAQPGQKFTVMLGEALSGPQTVNANPGGSVRYLSSDVTMVAGSNTYLVPLTPKDDRWMSAQTGPVMPFRYVEIVGAPPGLTKENIRQLVANYPFDDSAAEFKSSDAKLNAIWNLCRHTIKATSFAGVFIDGDRERTPYEADAYIDQLGWYYNTGDVTLPRYSWEYLIDHPTWPTEWSPFCVLLAWNDYIYTGDVGGLKEYYTDLQAKSLIGLEGTDGLISTVQPPVPPEVLNAIHVRRIRDIVDWPAHERDGYEMKPVNTVVNAFHALALRRLAQMADVLGHPDDKARFEAASVRVIQSINDKLFNPATGLYVDGEGSTHSSIHANFFPLAFGLVPAARREKIASYLAGHGMACSVYGAQFLMDALFDNGRGDDALALMTAPGDRSWSHMVDAGATMTWEAWDGKYKRNQDWNHAWGAAPADIIPRKIMGIEPLAAGFAKVLIEPRLTSLKWAEIRVPTVRGSVFARFENGPGYRLDVELPAGITGRIGIPVALPDGPGMLTFDGKQVPCTVTNKTAFLDGVGPGRHVVTRP
jgi:alpha-L-rhamnosidase